MRLRYRQALGNLSDFHACDLSPSLSVDDGHIVRLGIAHVPQGRGTFTMHRLRESVFRDLRWLLNSTSLDTTEELSRYPQVERSVLNYGMPALAGRATSSIDPRLTAERIALALRCFEPRLSKVRVVPEKHSVDNHEFALEFRIEAELWGQPAPQHLLMSTRINLDTGQVTLGEDGSR